MSIHEEYFEGRKPSKSQLVRSIKRGLKQGYTDFELSWGENMINLQKNQDNTWFGWGWTRRVAHWGRNATSVGRELSKIGRSTFCEPVCERCIARASWGGHCWYHQQQ
jgi:hypothetical protein